MSTSSEEVGDRFATALGDGPSRSTLAAQRVLVIEMAERRFRPRPAPNGRALALAAVLVVSVAVVFGARAMRSERLEARFRGAPVALDSPLVSAEARTDALEFTDGSRLVIEQNTRATLSALTSKHAGFRLLTGKVSASIRKHTGMTWTVTAGPYAVNVVGTRFVVEWDERTRAFAVSVREGRVRVTGGDLPAQGIMLEAGGRLERGVAGSATNAAPAAAPEAVVPEPVAAPSTGDLRPSTREAETPPPDSSARNGVAQLAAKGKYKEALALAEQQGFSRLTLELPENDLLLLANAARYSGNAGRAREALTKVRERFAGRTASSLAALYMAKIAEDMTHEPARAVHWLRVFLAESPNGDLAAGARASLMSLLLRSGDERGARAVAKEYLQYHPHGSHADEARALIGE
jgi:hypothetical protein